MWRVYLLSGLIACVAGSATAFITVQVIAPATTPGRTVTLEGEEFLAPDNETVVFYKTPFESPPYITTEGESSYRITDQKADSFKLKRVVPATLGADVKLKWKAEGQSAK
jgi:hypothetical protein